MTSEDKHYKLTVRAALVSLLVGLALMAVKFAAWAETGSAAILSDALESIINVVAGGFALVSVMYSAKPPDRRHPYGHGRIEYFSAGFEGALIMLAAGVIIWESWDKIFHPDPLANLDFGLWLLAAAGVVNLLLGVFLLRAGKRTGSLTLAADGRHVLTDFYTSGGVLAGLILVRLTGELWLDAAVACLVAVNILFAGFGLLRQAYVGLMLQADAKLLAEIGEVVQGGRKPRWLDVHKLRAWRSGRMIHMDFHLILPDDLPLHEAHDEVEVLEDVLREHFGPNTDVVIHADPCRGAECPRNGDPPAAFRVRSYEDGTAFGDGDDTPKPVS